MAEKKPIIKVNSNPNKTPAKGYNGYAKTKAEYKNIDAARKEHYNIPKNEKVVTRIKINTNPVTNHQPRIGGTGIGGAFPERLK